jgi:hypothetical protein
LATRNRRRNPQTPRPAPTFFFLQLPLAPTIPAAYKKIVSSASSGGKDDSTGLRSETLLNHTALAVRVARITDKKALAATKQNKKGPDKRQGLSIDLRIFSV